ncbi:UNVERIFIED_CONTAM: zinc metalloprotease HtpX, partial [Salmonella enterica subsp. enterica serovar Enteritidis]
NSVVAATDQLIRVLPARELTGVLAHELSHIRNEDLKVMALADTVSRFTSLMSTIGMVSLLFNITFLASGAHAQVPWLGVLVLLVAPTIGGLLQMALSRTREFDADLGASLLTGDPDGLAQALPKLEKAQGRLWEHLLLPGGRIPDPSILRTHPLTETRVARLKALKDASGVVARGEALPDDI